MVLQLQMVIINSHLHLLKAMHSSLYLAMVNLWDSKRLDMDRWLLLPDMGNTRPLNRVTLSRQHKITQVMDIKHNKILLMVPVLDLLMARQAGSQIMLNLHLVNQVMIRLRLRLCLNKVVMELFQ
jgi:hypothetical protein